MTRLTYSLPFIVATLALGACIGDDSGQVDTDGSDTGTGGDDVVDDGNDLPDDGMTTGDTTGDPTGVDASDSTGVPPGPCDDVVCEDGESCVGGICVPVATTGEICEEFGPGEWADCADGEACNGNGGGCLGTGVDGEGSCLFDCETVCDCPEIPATGTAVVACDDVAGPGGPDGIPDCYISCEDGETCPDGMICDGLFCVHTNNPPAQPAGPYEGCNVPTVVPCPPGNQCVANAAMPTASTCTQVGCMDADDCPAAPPGGTPACADLTGDDMNQCYLDCDTNADCPADSAGCFFATVCMYPFPEVGYDACPAFGGVCLAGEVCYEDIDMVAGTAYNVCTEGGCTDAGDCPLAPGSGTADPACADIGGGADTCYLDCSGGETCPTNMVCIDTLWCGFDSNNVCGIAIGDPSFETGSPNDAWDEASTNFGSPLCTAAGCGGGVSNTGDWFVWFGGIAALETASVEQIVTIPATANSLSLYLFFGAVSAVNPDQETVEVLIDGNQEFIATGDDAAMYPDYTEVLIDLTAYADDAPHTVRIQSTTQGAGTTNIFVDDVTLVCD